MAIYTFSETRMNGLTNGTYIKWILRPSFFTFHQNVTPVRHPFWTGPQGLYQGKNVSDPLSLLQQRTANTTPQHII